MLGSLYCSGNDHFRPRKVLTSAGIRAGFSFSNASCRISRTPLPFGKQSINGCEYAGRHLFLVKIEVRAGLAAVRLGERLFHVCENNEPGVRHDFSKPQRALDPVQSWHVQLCDDEIRLQRLGYLYQLDSVLRRPHDFDSFLLLQKTTQSIQVLWRVIHDYDPNARSRIQTTALPSCRLNSIASEWGIQWVS